MNGERPYGPGAALDPVSLQEDIHENLKHDAIEELMMIIHNIYNLNYDHAAAMALCQSASLCYLILDTGGEVRSLQHVVLWQ